MKRSRERYTEGERVERERERENKIDNFFDFYPGTAIVAIQLHVELLKLFQKRSLK